MSLIRPRNYPCNVSFAWVDILIATVTRSRSLIFTTGLASVPLLCLSDLGVTLEPPQLPLTQIPPNEQATSQQNALFVNPSFRDETGNGSESAPFKTITQALQVAQPNHVIILSTGTYSTSSGETFPLILKPGVSIQGDPRTKGNNILIKGGGVFLSPTFARQNITILGANQAGLIGVTVTNPNPRGYGLWIESTSPVVNNNTFTENKHDGISITGNSAPNIRSNYFYQNGANGMTIYGTSRPEVRENVFEKTGFGINIAQKAAPMLIGNRITDNRAGIVAQANTRPVLRGNVIEGSTEDGVVAIANSQPDLGTATEPGGNVFRQNHRYDINSIASNQVISAFGNQLANDRTSGQINLAGNSPVVTPANNVSTSLNINEVKHADEEVRVVTTTTPIAIAVPLPESTPQVPVIPSSQQQISLRMTPNIPNQKENSDITDSNTVPVVPPPPQPDGIPPLPVLQPAPIVVTELLPVPSPNIPVGNSRQLPPVVVPTNSLLPSAEIPPLPPTRGTLLGLRYRVVVEAESKSKQSLVRSLIPGAFRTFSKGRVFMQAGAFSDRAKANEIQQMLIAKGLKATIEQMN